MIIKQIILFRQIAIIVQFFYRSGLYPLDFRVQFYLLFFQAECEELGQRADILKQENAALRTEVERIRKEYDDLLAQNSSLKVVLSCLPFKRMMCYFYFFGLNLILLLIFNLAGETGTDMPKF